MYQNKNKFSESSFLKERSEKESIETIIIAGLMVLLTQLLTQLNAVMASTPQLTIQILLAYLAVIIVQYLSFEVR